MVKKRINYFDCGLCWGREFDWIVNNIFPNLGITEYHAYGFEPCKSCFDDLDKKYSGRKNVTLVNAAIFNKTGKNKLYHSYRKKKYTPIGNSLFETKWNIHKDDYEEVDCIIFSDWVKQNVSNFEESFNIIRMNMEGGEWCLFNDFKKNNMLKFFDIYCGSNIKDEMQKIEELQQYIPETLDLLKEHNITIHHFVDKPDISVITNLIRDRLELLPGNCKRPLAFFERQKKFIFKDVVVQDSYLIRDLPKDIDFIVDIGANIGVFSTYARYLFPEARIVAIEPDKDNYLNLTNNLKDLYVSCRNMAYGDGRDLFLKDNGGGVQTFENESVNSDSYMVKSFSLKDIFETNNLETNKNYVIKLDCEGGERFLLNNNDNDIIRNCQHFCMEIHFPNRTFEQFSKFPSFERYNNWVKSFSDTHKIIYHHSRKHSGHGVYVLSKKKI